MTQSNQTDDFFEQLEKKETEKNKFQEEKTLFQEIEEQTKPSKAGRPTWKNKKHEYKKTYCAIRQDYKNIIKTVIAQGEALSQDHAIEIALKEFFESRNIETK